MKDRTRGLPWSAAEGRLWTGAAAHLLGGALDFAEALARHLLRRARGRRIR